MPFKITSHGRALRVAAQFTARSMHRTSHVEILQDLVDTMSTKLGANKIRVAYYYPDPYGCLHIQRVSQGHESLIEESHYNQDGIPPEGAMKHVIERRGIQYVPDIQDPTILCDFLDESRHFGATPYNLGPNETRKYIETYGPRFKSSGFNMDIAFGCLWFPGHQNRPDQILGVIRADSFDSGEPMVKVRKQSPKKGERILAFLERFAILTDIAAITLVMLNNNRELENKVTDYSKINEQLHRLNSELERLNEELQLKEQTARTEYTKAVDLLRILKHDASGGLTTPLGYLNMVLEDMDQQEGGEIDPHKAAFYRKCLEKAALSLKNISPRLERSVSRVRGGNLDIYVELKPTMVAKIFAQYVEYEGIRKVLNLEFGKLGKLIFDLQISEDLPEIISTDKSQVLNVLNGLVENCTKHAPGSPITIAARKVDREIEISVSDSGPGLTKEQADKIFDDDYYMNGPTTGTGTGLKGFKKIITKLGGRIWAESEGLGKGSKFTFTLPIA